ncbi:putative serine-rich protein [Thermoascus aurantiacus ATCC 26904]
MRSSSPKRRALHERTRSQTNSRPPSRSIRLVDSKEEVDVYPTRPEHVLLPDPGKDAGVGVSDAPQGPTTAAPSTTGLVDEGDQAEGITGDVCDLSSSAGAGNSPGQVWDDDPHSSTSSIPDPVAPGKTSHDETPRVASSRAVSDDEALVLPTVTPTIKPVPPESSSSSQSLPADPSVDALSSSPNVVPIGPSSSPNLVPLGSSSPNVAAIGSSSPSVVAIRSHSSISSLNSLGTVIRTHIGAAQPSRASSADHPSSQPQSFHSSPPTRVLVSARSASTFALPSPESNGSRPATASSRSTPSASDIQAFIDSGVPIQYPTIRAPSAGSWAESFSSSLVPSPLRLMTDRSSERWNPNLSTIPSEWTEERQLSLASPSTRHGRSDSSLPEPSRPSPARISNTTSSIRLVRDAEGDEQLDYLASLPASGHRRGNSALLGGRPSGSRPNSAQSIKRPGSSSSLFLNTIPAWARVYYSGDGQALQDYTLSLVDSRPSSALSPTASSPVVSRLPTAISRPRTRPRENTGSRPRQVTGDPRDPRSHWVQGPQLEAVPTHDPVPLDQPRNTWSPHLYLDKRVDCRRPMWQAPSIDSTAEPFFGRRNIQVYSFCLGFIFPPAWLIAAFLPLPPKPVFSQDESHPDIERAQQEKTLRFEERRYENARWWRNVNRCMVPVGIGITVIIVVLAVVGTTAGF